MRKMLASFASGLAGLALCLLVVRLSDATQLAPHFSAPGGEDDFSVRASWFFSAVCPAFATHATLGFFVAWVVATALGALLSASRAASVS